MSGLRIERDGPLLRVAMARPERRNAFDASLIEELGAAFADVPTASHWDLRSPHARYAILTQAGGKARVEMLALEYDWEEAADKALANGFPKWAEALLTGAVG